MSKFVIESNVPLTAKGGDTEIAATIRRLDVGQSFFVPDGEIKYRYQFYTAANHAGYKITSRKVDGGMRIWRVA